MVGYDESFAWISIVAVAVGVIVMATWWPAGKKVFLGQVNRITVTALGISGMGAAVAVSRLVSLTYRAFHVPQAEPWLIFGVFCECSACALLAFSYFLPSQSRETSPIHYRGLWWGLAAFVALMVTWWVRR